MVRVKDAISGLTARQREALAARQTDPRSAAALRAPAGPRARSSRSPAVPGTARWDAGAIAVDLPGLALLLSPNARFHRLAAAVMRAQERQAVARALAALEGCPVPPRPPWAVEITRVGPRVMDDDNATASAKGVRDAVAAWLEVDDGAVDLVRWTVTQSRGPFAVRIRIGGQTR